MPLDQARTVVVRQMIWGQRNRCGQVMHLWWTCRKRDVSNETLRGFNDSTKCKDAFAVLG